MSIERHNRWVLANEKCRIETETAPFECGECDFGKGKRTVFFLLSLLFEQRINAQLISFARIALHHNETSSVAIEAKVEMEKSESQCAVVAVSANRVLNCQKGQCNKSFQYELTPLTVCSVRQPPHK